MGKKMLVALMMEGKFSGEGLLSLDADDDLMSAMARELVEKAGVGASADQMCRELERERERVLPQPLTLKVVEDDNPVFDLSVTEPIGPAAERAGIYLVDPPVGAKVRKKSSPWSTGTGPAVQLSLFG
jgi:8-oxo-dGTP pyrophosphatase MutT (NUDIX family)